jgi:chromosome segregation ATPase
MKFAASTFAAAILFGLGLAIGAGATGSHYRAKIASMKTEQAQREAAAVAQALATQQSRIDKIQGALDAAQKQTIQARADADAAAAATRKLRKSLADYRARHANTAASSGQGEPGSDPIGVLAELLEGLADRGAEVSRYADEVKIAGAACEAAR